MEAPKPIAEILGAKLFSINPDPKQVDYILSKEEEEIVLQYERERLEAQATYTFSKGLLPQDEVNFRVKNMGIAEYVLAHKTEILAAANERKVWVKEAEERELKRKAEAAKKLEELKEFWTAQRLFKFMRYMSEERYGRPLEVDNDNKRLIEILCKFLARSRSFEEDLKFDLNKGLLMRGTCGLGKSYLPLCLSENELNPIFIESAKQITKEIQEEGEYDIFTKMGNRKIICIDDVGAEDQDAYYYKTKIHWFQDFIENFSLKRKNFYNTLIVSTNLSFDQIEDFYGSRVRSRMAEMFNYIDVKGKDRRKK